MPSTSSHTRLGSMSSLAIVRGLVKMLMEVDADDEERRKRKQKMRKLTILKTRHLPDEDDDDPVDAT
jgi:hypothetical protein